MLFRYLIFAGIGILLALIGGLPGLGLAILFIVLVRDSLTGILPHINVAPEILLAGVAIMVILGVVTGLVPALGAMRLKIAAALGRG